MRKQKSLYLDSSDLNSKTSYLKYLLNRSTKTAELTKIKNFSDKEIPKISVHDKIKQIESKNHIEKRKSKSYSSITPKTKIICERTLVDDVSVISMSSSDGGNENEKKFEKEMIKQIKNIDKAIEIIEKEEKSTITSRKEHYELKNIQKKQEKLYEEFKEYQNSYIRSKYQEIEEKYKESEKKKRLLEEKNKKLKEELDKYVKYQKLNLKIKQYEIEIQNSKEIQEKLMIENSSLKDRFESNYNLIQDVFEEKEILKNKNIEMNSKNNDLNLKLNQIQIEMENEKSKNENEIKKLKEENEKLKSERMNNESNILKNKNEYLQEKLNLFLDLSNEIKLDMKKDINNKMNIEHLIDHKVGVINETNMKHDEVIDQNDLNENINQNNTLDNILDTNQSNSSDNSNQNQNQNEPIIELDNFNINDKLHECIINSNENDFLKYIELKRDDEIDLERRYSNKMTLLHLSCSKNLILISEILINKGSDLNSMDSQSRTPLHISANHGYYDICILLLGNGSKINVRDLYGHSPIMLALKSHHFHLIPDLQLFGGDINFKRDNGMTILHEVMQTSDEELFNYLIEMKGLKFNQKDQDGQTPLLKSAQFSSPKLIFQCLNLKYVDSKMVDDSGRNLFHLLAKYSRNDVFDYISTFNQLKNHSNLFLKKDLIKGSTPLHIAIHSGNLETVQSIVQIQNQILKIDITTLKDNKGLTPYSLSLQKLQKVKSFNDDSSDEIIKQKKLKFEKIKEYLQFFQKKRKTSLQMFVESL
eukprot:gene4134-7444_t